MTHRVLNWLSDTDTRLKVLFCYFVLCILPAVLYLYLLIRLQFTDEGHSARYPSTDISEPPPRLSLSEPWQTPRISQ